MFGNSGRGIYWPQEHNDVIQKILGAARKGIQVVYIPGNHGEFVSRSLTKFLPAEEPALLSRAD